jgi:hypothetical protein
LALSSLPASLSSSNNFEIGSSIVREFCAAFEQVQEVELARRRLIVYQLELLGDGLAELNADMRAGRLS